MKSFNQLLIGEHMKNKLKIVFTLYIIVFSNIALAENIKIIKSAGVEKIAECYAIFIRFEKGMKGQPGFEKELGQVDTLLKSFERWGTLLGEAKFDAELAKKVQLHNTTTEDVQTKVSGECIKIWNKAH